jgi:hypothetical protein
MATEIAIPQNIFLLALAVIALIAIIVVVIQWKKVRETQNNVTLMEKQIELKKIALVEKDLESKRLMETAIPLPADQQEKLATIRKNTSELMHEVGFLHSEISERLARLETQTEYKKLQKMLKDIEVKEKELDKDVEKVKGE